MKIAIIGLSEDARLNANAELGTRWAWSVEESEFEGCSDIVIDDAVIFKAYSTDDSQQGGVIVLDLGGNKVWIFRSDFVEVKII